MAIVALFVMLAILLVAAAVSYALHRVLKRYIAGIIATGILYVIVGLAFSPGGTWTPKRFLVTATWGVICMGVSAWVGWGLEKRRRRQCQAPRGFDVLPAREIEQGLS